MYEVYMNDILTNKLIKLVKNECDDLGVKLIYLTIDGSYVSGRRNKDSDIDLIGYVECSDNNIRDIKRIKLIPEYTKIKSIIDIKLYTINTLYAHAIKQKLLGYRYLTNRHVLINNPDLRNKIVSMYQYYPFLKRMYTDSYNEFKEYLCSIHDAGNIRAKYKKARYIIQDIAVVYQYLEYLKIGYTYTDYLNINSTLLFKLLLNKILTTYNYTLSDHDLNTLKNEFNRLKYRICYLSKTLLTNINVE